MAGVGKCSCTECNLVLLEDVTPIACSLCEEWMHRTFNPCIVLGRVNNDRQLRV